MEDNKSMTVKKTIKSGITFGSALAMVISYTTWKSVGWAIFHVLCLEFGLKKALVDRFFKR